MDESGSEACFPAVAGFMTTQVACVRWDDALSPSLSQPLFLCESSTGLPQCPLCQSHSTWAESGLGRPPRFSLLLVWAESCPHSCQTGLEGSISRACVPKNSVINTSQCHLSHSPTSLSWGSTILDHVSSEGLEEKPQDFFCSPKILGQV